MGIGHPLCCPADQKVPMIVPPINRHISTQLKQYSLPLRYIVGIVNLQVSKLFNFDRTEMYFEFGLRQDPLVQLKPPRTP